MNVVFNAKNERNWEWNPRVNIGCFYFGRAIDVKNLKFAFCEIESVPSGSGFRKVFEICDEGSRFVLDNGILTSIECVSLVLYKDVNLIGLDTDEARRLLAAKCKVSDQWSFGKQIDCDELGAILWEENGIVESATLSA